jgi:transcriptional regulator with XRE-family HTH domain
MEWGADRILALRKHAGMTQAQIAQWLGVTIKQVKYLEHQRRNPSGPTRRLLSILAAQLKFSGPPPVQVLGAADPKIVTRKTASPRRKPPPTTSTPQEPAPLMLRAAVEALESPKPVDEKPPPPQPEADESPGDGAFTWQ